MDMALAVGGAAWVWLIVIATAYLFGLAIEAAWRSRAHVTAAALALLFASWVAIGVGLGAWP